MALGLAEEWSRANSLSHSSLKGGGGGRKMSNQIFEFKKADKNENRNQCESIDMYEFGAKNNFEL